jgi:23S rRNA (uracil1939-C5)-methyltransferase
VKIEKPLYGGDFLARVDGKAIFVPLTLPGEQVRARVVAEKKSYATAEPEEIVTASPHRVAPACRHFGSCGGCQYQHADYEAQLEIKRVVLRETLERGGVPLAKEIETLAAEPWAYRNRIRVAIDATGRVGYRGRRSHAIVPIVECPIAAPLLVRAALAAGDILRESRAIWRPDEILLFCDGDETALLADVFAAGSAGNQFQQFCARLAERIPELRGAELAAEDRDGGPPRLIAQWGAASLVYRAGGVDYRVDQGAFFQVNRLLVDQLADYVTHGVQGALTWDLFAGVGLFARQLAEKFAQVVAVESAAAALPALEHNLAGKNARVVQATTLQFLQHATEHPRPDLIVPDLIVIDPPRIGLGPKTTELLTTIGVPAIAYVSCDPATLARDLRAMISTGYEIDSVALVDLFPQTFHLETIVLLSR